MHTFGRLARPSIQPWDWRYRAGFDAAISSRVHEVLTCTATHAERQLLLDQLDAFKQIASLSALLDAVQECPQRTEEFLQAFQSERLLYVPSLLADRLTGRIEGLSGCSASARRQLRDLLAAAVHRKFVNPCAALAEVVFGRHTGTLMGTRKDAPKMWLDRAARSLSTHELHRCIVGLRDSWSINPLSVGMPIPEFTLELQNRRGFAEYWPAELSASGVNTMILFNLHCQGGEPALQATLAHELIGHAAFYEFEKSHPSAVLDHGAFGLIEGWATWCEWHAFPSSFSARSRASAVQALDWLLASDPTFACSAITRHVEALGYTQSSAEDAIEYHFQYPLFAASYTLGALWFERRLAGARPMDFFVQIQGRAWGDFFDTW